MEVLVLGGSGMLGSMVTDYFSKYDNLNITATVRDEKLLEKFEEAIPNASWKLFEANAASEDELEGLINNKRWVVNALGITKYYIDDSNPDNVGQAIRVNSLFPFKLAQVSSKYDAQVLQIATDCVYSGIQGDYNEASLHDPHDVYGKTKSLGETFLPNSHFLRCSFIGPESKAYVLLLEWFRKQPQNTCLNGYNNHLWNGITTLHAAKLYHAIISKELKLPHLQHVIPNGTISKAELLKCLAHEYDRKDISINPINAPTSVNRVLSTNNNDLNNKLWNAAGYSTPPTIPEMIEELANYKYPIL